MKKYILLGALLGMSVCTIGSPEPDRQTLDQEVISHESLEVFRAEYKITANPSFDEGIVITEQEAVFASISVRDSFLDNGVTDGSIAILPYEVLSERGHGDIVIEEDKHKPSDSYRYPIWDFEPIAEPPSNLRFS